MRCFLISLLLGLTLVLNAQTFEEKANISFNVVVEKEIEADVLIVNYKVEKKDKDFKTATVGAAFLIDKLKTALKSAGVKEADIVTDKLSTMPDKTWYNSKEYLVKSLIKVKISDKSLIADVFSKTGNIDSQIGIDSFDYDYSGVDIAKTELIKLASEKAEMYKTSYEKNFKLKLSIHTINVNDNFEDSMPKYRNAALTKMMDTESYSEPMITSLPVKNLRMMMFIKYSIDK